MTDRPNITGSWTYDWSWTQPYVSMNEFFQGQSSVAEEIKRLDKIDEDVQKMLTFPDVEAILNKIKEAK